MDKKLEENLKMSARLARQFMPEAIVNFFPRVKGNGGIEVIEGSKVPWKKELDFAGVDYRLHQKNQHEKRIYNIASRVVQLRDERHLEGEMFYIRFCKKGKDPCYSEYRKLLANPIVDFFIQIWHDKGVPSHAYICNMKKLIGFFSNLEKEDEEAFRYLYMNTDRWYPDSFLQVYTEEVRRIASVHRYDYKNTRM